MKIYTVSALNRVIKDLIDNEFILEDVAVTGELSSFSITRNIAYFTLKDSEGMLSCVQFSAKQEFNVGDFVQVRGNVKYYPKGGKLSLNVFEIEPCGQGELYQQFLKLKEKLQKEGLFDEAHKIPLPRFINSVGVVTSKTGAVLQDIKNVTSRRNPNLDIYVYDAQVQGKMAVQNVIEGITYFDNLSDVDVIVVARGGGSLEDLAPFNDEELARVAYICNKPLISAVGHETDFSILDFVADLRAPTPSAAAELITFNNADLKNYIKDLVSAMSMKTDKLLVDLKNDVDLSILSIENNLQSIIADENMSIVDLINQIEKNVVSSLDNATYRVNMSLNTLDKLNPIKLLQRGYSSVTVQGNSVNYENVHVGDSIKVVAADVILKAEIKEKEKKC